MTFQGFPIKLPYFDYSPDYYSSFYGFGGAKIVSIIGFFGLATELNLDKRDMKFLIISIINFVLPSFLISAIVGVFALILVYTRGKSKTRRIILIFVSLFFIFFTTFLNSRIQNLNSEVKNDLGLHPKLYAYALVGEIYLENPEVLIIGGGIGQFSSAPAIWTSKYIRSASNHEIPKFGDLKMSELHKTQFEKKMVWVMI